MHYRRRLRPYSSRSTSRRGILRARPHENCTGSLNRWMRCSIRAPTPLVQAASVRPCDPRRSPGGGPRLPDRHHRNRSGRSGPEAEVLGHASTTTRRLAGEPGNRDPRAYLHKSMSWSPAVRGIGCSIGDSTPRSTGREKLQKCPAPDCGRLFFQGHAQGVLFDTVSVSDLHAAVPQHGRRKSREASRA